MELQDLPQDPLAAIPVLDSQLASPICQLPFITYTISLILENAYSRKDCGDGDPKFRKSDILPAPCTPFLRLSPTYRELRPIAKIKDF
jgi:hypothetical protein